MKTLDHDALLKRRKLIQDTIVDLERGKLAAEYKIQEAAWCRGREIPGTRLAYDDDALDRQVEQAEKDIEAIEKTLAEEREKLDTVGSDLAASHAILKMHGTTACLLGVEDHTWVVTKRHFSGRFAKRHCSVCGTKQAVGEPI